MQTKILTGLAALTLAALCGCQSTSRVALDTTAAAAGGVVAERASHGNPYWTLAGGLAGVALAETAQKSSRDSAQEQLALAYERGASQTAQKTYAAIQNAQKPAASSAPRDESQYTEIPITAPKRTINGVTIEPSVEYIRVTTK